MPTRAGVHLHSIEREIRRVQSRLESARRGASEADRAYLQDLIRKLEKIRVETSSLCPRVWGVWPLSGARSRAAAPPKPGGRRAKRKPGRQRK